MAFVIHKAIAREVLDSLLAHWATLLHRPLSTRSQAEQQPCALVNCPILDTGKCLRTHGVYEIQRSKCGAIIVVTRSTVPYPVEGLPEYLRDLLQQVFN